MKYTGTFKAVYDIDEKELDHIQSHVKITKKDGKQFYIPTSDILDIAELIGLIKEVKEKKERVLELVKRK